MRNPFRNLRWLYRTNQPIPAGYRRNFFHLTFDMAWFGVLNGSTIAFLSIYAARLGGTSLQLGLITAAPAIINIIFAMPAVAWLKQRPIERGVFSTSVMMRSFYLLLIPLAFLSSNSLQVWVIILIVLVMNIPGTALTVGFNALFGEAVPIQWRGYVAGLRNAFYSIFTIVSTLACGWVLSSMSFRTGYQMVFAMGFVGAALSSLNLWFIRPLPQPNGALAAPPFLSEEAKDQEQKRRMAVRAGRLIPIHIRPKGITSEFNRVAALFFLFHLFQYLAIPLFPLYMVNTLLFSDEVISLGTGVFYLAMFLGSLRLMQMCDRLGYQKVTALGAILLAAYPALLQISYSGWVFMLASIVGGLAWGMVNGAMLNYLLERAPADDRPGHLAWYNLALNVAILLGSFGGPLLAQGVGLPAALLIAAAGRLLAGISMLRWG